VAQTSQARLDDVCPPTMANAATRKRVRLAQPRGAGPHGWLGIIFPQQLGGHRRSAIELAI